MFLKLDYKLIKSKSINKDSIKMKIKYNLNQDKIYPFKTYLYINNKISKLGFRDLQIYKNKKKRTYFISPWV